MWIYLIPLTAVILALSPRSTPRRDLTIMAGVILLILAVVTVQQGLLTWRG